MSARSDGKQEEVGGFSDSETRLNMDEENITDFGDFEDSTPTKTTPGSLLSACCMPEDSLQGSASLSTKKKPVGVCIPEVRNTKSNSSGRHFGCTDSANSQPTDNVFAASPENTGVVYDAYQRPYNNSFVYCESRLGPTHMVDLNGSNVAHNTRAPVCMCVPESRAYGGNSDPTSGFASRSPSRPTPVHLVPNQTSSPYASSTVARLFQIAAHQSQNTMLVPTYPANQAARPPGYKQVIPVGNYQVRPMTISNRQQQAFLLPVYSTAASGGLVRPDVHSVGPRCLQPMMCHGHSTVVTSAAVHQQHGSLTTSYPSRVVQQTLPTRSMCTGVERKGLPNKTNTSRDRENNSHSGPAGDDDQHLTAENQTHPWVADDGDSPRTTPIMPHSSNEFAGCETKTLLNVNAKPFKSRASDASGDHVLECATAQEKAFEDDSSMLILPVWPGSAEERTDPFSQWQDNEVLYCQSSPLEHENASLLAGELAGSSMCGADSELARMERCLKQTLGIPDKDTECGYFENGVWVIPSKIHPKQENDDDSSARPFRHSDSLPSGLRNVGRNEIPSVYSHGKGRYVEAQKNDWTDEDPHTECVRKLEEARPGKHHCSENHPTGDGCQDKALATDSFKHVDQHGQGVGWLLDMLRNNNKQTQKAIGSERKTKKRTKSSENKGVSRQNLTTLPCDLPQQTKLGIVRELDPCTDDGLKNQQDETEMNTGCKKAEVRCADKDNRTDCAVSVPRKEPANTKPNNESNRKQKLSSTKEIGTKDQETKVASEDEWKFPKRKSRSSKQKTAEQERPRSISAKEKKTRSNLTRSKSRIVTGQTSSSNKQQQTSNNSVRNKPKTSESSDLLNKPKTPESSDVKSARRRDDIKWRKVLLQDLPGPVSVSSPRQDSSRKGHRGKRSRNDDSSGTIEYPKTEPFKTEPPREHERESLGPRERQKRYTMRFEREKERRPSLARRGHLLREPPSKTVQPYTPRQMMVKSHQQTTETKLPQKSSPSIALGLGDLRGYSNKAESLPLLSKPRVLPSLSLCVGRRMEHVPEATCKQDDGCGSPNEAQSSWPSDADANRDLHGSLSRDISLGLKKLSLDSLRRESDVWSLEDLEQQDGGNHAQRPQVTSHSLVKRFAEKGDYHLPRQFLKQQASSQPARFQVDDTPSCLSKMKGAKSDSCELSLTSIPTQKRPQVIPEEDPLQLLPHGLLTTSPPKPQQGPGAVQLLQSQPHRLPGILSSGKMPTSNSAASHSTFIASIGTGTVASERSLIPSSGMGTRSVNPSSSAVGAIGQIPASWSKKRPEARYELRVPGDSWPHDVNPAELLPKEFPADTVLDLRKPSISVEPEYWDLENLTLH